MKEGNKGLSHKKLSQALKEKFDLTISDKQLMYYESAANDEYHSKAKNVYGMASKTLFALSKFYNVSSDYLLGLTDIQTPDINVRSICKCVDCKFGRHPMPDVSPEKYFKDTIIICENKDVVGDDYMMYPPEHFCSFGERSVVRNSIGCEPMSKYYAIAFLDSTGNGFSVTEPYVYDDMPDIDDYQKLCENMKKSGLHKVTPFAYKENELPESITWDFVLSHRIGNKNDLLRTNQEYER